MNKSYEKERRKRCVFRRLRKTGRNDADVTWRGRSFQVQSAATGKAWSPTVDSRVRRTGSDVVSADRRRVLIPRSAGCLKYIRHQHHHHRTKRLWWRAVRRLRGHRTKLRKSLESAWDGTSTCYNGTLLLYITCIITLIVVTVVTQRKWSRPYLWWSRSTRTWKKKAKLPLSANWKANLCRKLPGHLFIPCCYLH